MSLVVTLADGLSLVLPGAGGAARAYPTVRLQRGLLLVDGARDLAEEGVGFGVPVLKCGVRAVFAGGMEAEAQDEGRVCTIRTVYKMDLVERLSVAGGGTVKPRALYAAKDALAALHRRVPAARGPLTAASSALRRRFRWETVYVPAASLAEVPVTYVVDRDRGTLRMHVDLAGLPAQVTEVAMMNEQGARAFDTYEDAAGVVLQGGTIGSWDEVTAPGARFVSPASRVAFSMDKVEGTTLRRGRELVGARLAWAGFALTVPSGRRDLTYEVRVGRAP